MDTYRWKREIEKLSDDDLNGFIAALQKLSTWEVFVKYYGGISGIKHFLIQEYSKRRNSQ